jgi:carbon-monoxide dehydrogenase medium subunit
LPDAEKSLLGGALSEAGIRELGQALSEATDPVDDVRASADFRRLLIPRMVARAFSTAQEELGA